MTSLPLYRVRGLCPSAVINRPIRSSVSAVTMREASSAVTTGMRTVMTWRSSSSARVVSCALAGPVTREATRILLQTRHRADALAARSQ